MTLGVDQTCSNCRFYDGDDECHRHAPHSVPDMFYAIALVFCRNDPEADEIVGDGTANRPGFPRINPENFCGEWEGKAE